MTGTDHPPSTTRPAHLAPTEHLPRRALLTCVAAVSAIAIGVAVVVATVGGTALAAASEPFASTTTSILRDQRDVRAQDRGEAALANIEDLAVAVAPTTRAAPTPTTPPAPPTTVAPPPPPPPAPAVRPVVSGSGYNDPNNPAAWDRLAGCESGGSWAANTGNGYYGGIQFSLASWQSVGGTGRPDEASRETQIALGQRLWNQGGWVHWPACSSQLGYR